MARIASQTLRAGRGLSDRLARSCAARPRATLGAWAAAVSVSLALTVAFLHGLSSSELVSGTPGSARAAQLLARGFPGSAAGAAGDVIVVRSARYTVDARAFRSFVSGLVARVRATGSVGQVTSYLGGAAPVSGDRHATLVELSIVSSGAAPRVETVVQRANATPGFSATITGDRTVLADFDRLAQSDLEHGELEFGLPAALLVLVLVFGALVAGLVPVLMALVSILVGLGIVALLSLTVSLSVFIVNMLTGMGLALGIDYSLFVISRYREERDHGRAKEAAIRAAAATASRAVLFSGSIFVVSLLGMLIVPTSVMRSLAAGAIIVGVVSVAAALTLLPALLVVLGDRVDALAVPFLASARSGADDGGSRIWQALVHGVLRRPRLSLVLAVAALVAAAVPTLGMHIGESGVATLPSSQPARQGYAALEQTFPAQNPYPVEVVTQGGGRSTLRDLALLRRELAGIPRFGPATIRSGRDGIAVLSAPVRGDAVGGGAVAAVRHLRSRLVPAAFAGSATRVYVGGKTAKAADYFAAVSGPTPYVLVFVLGVAFCVLTLAFRSLVVAALSILLNLLSIGAAYGLLTLVFVRGVGAGLFGFQHVPTINAWVPLFLFSVLFGLSMDYQVFLMSRIHERHEASGSTREAVATGVVSTARIITGAALIIVVVFVGFARGQLVEFQQMGFGVAVALLLDATVIRIIVLPSALHLLGERSWYLPPWLAWLPHLDIHATPTTNVEPAAPTP